MLAEKSNTVPSTTPLCCFLSCVRITAPMPVLKPWTPCFRHLQVDEVLVTCLNAAHSGVLG